MTFKQMIKPYLAPGIWRFLQKAKIFYHKVRARIARIRGRAADRYYLIRDKTYRCNVRGQTIMIKVSSGLERYRVRTYASKEPETLEWIDRHLRDKDVLFDVGANIGLYSLYAAKSKPEATIYGFEPESLNFSRFCINTHANQLKNLIPCNIPLNDVPAFNYFQISDFTVGSSMHNFGDFTDFSQSLSIKAAFRQGALGTSIDRLVEEFGLPAPNLIKIDVDGIEEKIVTGMLKTAAKSSVRSILIEITDRASEVSPIHRQLADLGFRVEVKGADVRYGGYRCQNHIFVRD